MCSEFTHLIFPLTSIYFSLTGVFEVYSGQTSICIFPIIEHNKHLTERKPSRMLEHPGWTVCCSTDLGLLHTTLIHAIHACRTGIIETLPCKKLSTKFYPWSHIRKKIWFEYSVTIALDLHRYQKSCSLYE